MQHHPHHHGSTGPTFAADPNDGAFAAVIAVPIVVFVAIWAVQVPTAAVGIAGFAVGAKAAKSEIPARVADAVRPRTRRRRTTDDSPATGAAAR